MADARLPCEATLIRMGLAQTRRRARERVAHEHGIPRPIYEAAAALADAKAEGVVADLALRLREAAKEYFAERGWNWPT